MAWAERLLINYGSTLQNADVFLGAPEGGKSLADKLAYHTSRGYCYPNVKETPVAGGRPKKEFVWERHELERGLNVVIIEDVANNFSTTGKLMKLVIEAGCTPIALVCLLNRSLSVDTTFTCEHGEIPVVSLVRKPMPEYRQDDPEVVDDIAANNIVWKPRSSPEAWQRLMDAMAQQS